MDAFGKVKNDELLSLFTNLGYASVQHNKCLVCDVFNASVKVASSFNLFRCVKWIR